MKYGELQNVGQPAAGKYGYENDEYENGVYAGKAEQELMIAEKGEEFDK